MNSTDQASQAIGRRESQCGFPLGLAGHDDDLAPAMSDNDPVR